MMLATYYGSYYSHPWTTMAAKVIATVLVALIWRIARAPRRPVTRRPSGAYYVQPSRDGYNDRGVR